MSPLLQLRNVSKHYAAKQDAANRIACALGAAPRHGTLRAVDGVNLELAPGEAVGLAGESGCGKSTLARLAVGLLEPTSGARLWRGSEVNTLALQARRAIQLKAQMIFQDSHAALNPRLRALDIVGEAPLVHGMIAPDARQDYVAGLFARVGLDPALAQRYPHQLSGGQRARIGIARALAVRPELLVCDEAVAALDVSIQAQVLNLLAELRTAYDLAYLFISHDLNVLRHVADRILVMYLGRVVETAPTEELFLRAHHPYVQALLADAPRLEAQRRRFVTIQGELPSPLAPPPGCHFHPRCPHAMSQCRIEAPVLREIAPQHFSACHLNHRV